MEAVKMMKHRFGRKEEIRRIDKWMIPKSHYYEEHKSERRKHDDRINSIYLSIYLFFFFF